MVHERSIPPSETKGDVTGVEGVCADQPIAIWAPPPISQTAGTGSISCRGSGGRPGPPDQDHAARPTVRSALGSLGPLPDLLFG